MNPSFYIISLIWGIVAIVLLPVAWVAARREAEALHKWVMCLLVAGGWAFVINYLFMSRAREAYMELSGPFVLWFAVHGLVGLLTLLVATALLVSRLSSKGKDIESEEGSFLNRKHALIGTITIIFWLLTHIGGILNLYLLG